MITTNRFYIMAICFACFVGVVSCNDKEESPSCSTAWSQELQDELNAVSNSGTVWANDPTPANCTSYKNAYQNYIDALRPYGNCSALTGQQRTDFESALNSAEADLATLCD